MKQIYLLLFLIGTFFVSFSAYAGDSVIACSSPCWVPFNWETETTLEGVGVDVAKMFFDREGADFKTVKIGSWSRCLKEAEMGKCDLVIAAYKTPEREKWGDYVPEAVGWDET